MTELRKKMIRAMELKNLSHHTQRAYLAAVTGIAKFYNQSPDKMTQEKIEDYLLYLKLDKGIAPNSCYGVLTGLRFFYKHVTEEEIPVTYSIRRTARKLPEVLTMEDIWKIICSANNLKHKMILMTTYSAGLRASETLNLKPENILHLHLNDYKAEYPLWPEHRKIATDLLNCRTARLGGHIERCDNCGAVRITYHSCRNRHCPKCQHMPRERWLEKRKEEILPTSYFHVVFTMPHELNTVILNNKKVMFNILFAAASRTLLTFGNNELNGNLGFLAVLHTWDQKLNAHFHLHFLVAGGVMSKDKKQWLPVKNDYLFNEEALSQVFRGKFMERLKLARKNGAFKFVGRSYGEFKSMLYAKNWIVSVREPVKRPEYVLEYLARYTHRVAIANSRIKKLENGNCSEDFGVNMAKYISWYRVNYALEKSQTGTWQGFHPSRLKYNTHIDLSCQIVAKRYRTSLFYQ